MGMSVRQIPEPWSRGVPPTNRSSHFPCDPIGNVAIFGKMPRASTVFVVGHSVIKLPTGKPSVTDWERLAVEGETTRVKLMPRTGRSHQLRVHMMEIGHPILGDPFYAHGPTRDDHPRLMLHAEGLKFEHPISGKVMRLEAPCPF